MLRASAQEPTEEEVEEAEPVSRAQAEKAGILTRRGNDV